MHAEKLAPAMIAAVAMACLLFAGRAHGLEEYVPAAAASQEVAEPLATSQNEQYLPQPEVMPMPTLFKRSGFAVYAPRKFAPQEEETTQPGAAATLAGALGGYFPQPRTTEPEAEPAPETMTMIEPGPGQKYEPEPATPTAPGQGDFYRTGETPTKPEAPATPSSPADDEKSTPEAPATPSSPASDEKSSYSGGSKEVDDDGEPVDGLSPKAIENILKEHNLFRAKEGERPLTWNATVAKYAQHYAEERKGDCALKHSQGGPYGENLMYGDGKAWTWRHTVDEWSAEKKNYHYTTNTCDPGKMCGHYTAVVWKDTTAVGCGRVTCNNGNTLMVCSYYPPGNYDGEKPY